MEEPLMNIYYLHNKHRWFNSGILWAAKFGCIHTVSWVTSAQNSLWWRQESQWCVRLPCLHMKMGVMKTESMELGFSTRSLIKGSMLGLAVTAKFNLLYFEKKLKMFHWTARVLTLWSARSHINQRQRFYSLRSLLFDGNEWRKCKNMLSQGWAVFPWSLNDSQVGSSPGMRQDSAGLSFLCCSGWLVMQLLNTVDALQTCHLWGYELYVFFF